MNEQFPGPQTPENNGQTDRDFSKEDKSLVEGYLKRKKNLDELSEKATQGDSAASRRADALKAYIQADEANIDRQGLNVDDVEAVIRADKEQELLDEKTKLDELASELQAIEDANQKMPEGMRHSTFEANKRYQAKMKSFEARAEQMREDGYDVDGILSAEPEMGDAYDETGAETDDTLTAQKKYSVMRSQEAQDAFMNGGELAYISYIENAFKELDNKGGDSVEEDKTPGTELELYNGDTAAQPESEPGTELAVPEPARTELEPAATPVEELEPAEADTEDDEEWEESPEAAELRELNEKLDEASNRYAELTARDRQSYRGRYTRDPRSNTGKILRFIPGMKKFVEKINTKQGGEIDDARVLYEQAMASMLDHTAKQMEINGTSEKKILEMRAICALGREAQFQDKVAEYRSSEEYSKKAGRLTNWWVKQEGFKGKLKKGAAVLALGAAVGATGGLILPGAVAAFGGGVAGAYMAHQITKRRANAKVDGEMTLAQKQAEEDKEKMSWMVNQYRNDVKAGGEREALDHSRFTGITEERSDQEAFENRSRVRKAFAAAKLGGIATGPLMDSFNMFESKASAMPEPVAPEAPAPEVPAPEPALNGENFTVESGSGYVNEIQQFAGANGHNLSPSQANELHQHLMSKFGADYIDINGGGNDIYTQGGDVRLSAPGSAQWSNGVPNEIKSWMTGRGLW